MGSEAVELRSQMLPVLTRAEKVKSNIESEISGWEWANNKQNLGKLTSRIDQLGAKFTEFCNDLEKTSQILKLNIFHKILQNFLRNFWKFSENLQNFTKI